MSPAVAAYMIAWPVLALAMLVGVIVLSYRIEKRSPDLTNRTGVPRMAMLFHTVTNLKVARDDETQRMRRFMLLLLSGIIAVFIVTAFVVSTIDESAV